MITEDERCDDGASPPDFATTSGASRNREDESTSISPPASTQLRSPVLLATASSLNQVQSAYAQFEVMTKWATHSIESNGALLATEITELQRRAVETIHASVCAANDFVEAIHCATGPAAIAAAQFEHSKWRIAALSSQMSEFLASASNMIAAMTTPLNSSAQNCPQSMTCPAGPCDEEKIAERLKSLTARQRNVLELLVDGLPNKVIAYELGICETTVKAHVGEILRKLCVYNRARAISMLARLRLGAGVEAPSRQSED
jgi:DNA-binding NarL/FixJ family response regulator